MGNRDSGSELFDPPGTTTHECRPGIGGERDSREAVLGDSKQENRCVASREPLEVRRWPSDLPPFMSWTSDSRQ